MRYNTELFIKKANDVHNNTYDYSLVNYIRSRGKVKIICPIHGEFEQVAAEHIVGKGCRFCAPQKTAQSIVAKKAEKFVERAHKIHGDKYDYSEMVYTDSRNKVTIICPIHGAFEQVAAQHLLGHGCPKCGRESARGKTAIQKKKRFVVDTLDFIEQAQQIHGDKYDYTKVKFVNMGTPICIICPKHGEFFQKPLAHLNGYGCFECARKTMAMGKYKTTDEFIKEAKAIHGDKYDYSKSTYKGCKTPICIICKEHGEFWQPPTKHLSGHNCPKCSNNARSTTKRKTKEWFIEKAIRVHGNKYDYSEVEYINDATKVKIICHKKNADGVDHGAFWQTPNSHTDNEHGCPICGAQLRISENRFFDFLKAIFPNVEIIREYQKKELLGKQRIDFFFPKYNIGIEYQGAQHFHPIKLFGGEKSFKVSVERDKRKYRICEHNGIKMFYFTYTPWDVTDDYFVKVFTSEGEIKEALLNCINNTIETR